MKDIPLSPRIIAIKRKRRALKIRLAILFVISFALIVWLLSFLSSIKNVTISEITITGTHIVDQADIENIIRKDISGKYLYIFPKNNSLIYPRRKIKNDLIKTIPRIENLSVYIDRLNSLHIDIDERKGSYLYCGSEIPQEKNEVGENCYFINNDGYIFDKAPYYSGNVYFKYYLKLDDESVDCLGQQMLEVDYFHKIARFIDAVTAMGFKPIYLQVGDDQTGHLYLYHGAKSTSPEIIFKMDDDLDLIEDNLRIAVSKNEFFDEINSKYNSLLYIDLRFENKVLYKFK